MKEQRNIRYAKNLKVVMNVFFWFGMIVTGIGVAAACTLPFLPERWFETSSGAFSLDEVIRYSIDGAEAVNLQSVYVLISVSASIFACGIGMICRQLKAILQTVQDKQPFVPDNAHRIRVIGLIFLAGAFIVRGVQALVAYAIIDAFGIEDLSVNYSIDFALVIASFLMIVLAEVFRYGTNLQQDVDATV